MTPRTAFQEAPGVEEPGPLPSYRQILLGPYARHPRCWSSRQVFFASMSLIALIYLGLYHPYWVRGGDSELYLVIARNLVRGEGYTYNNQPVALVPPLWPMVLAGAFWVTSVVGFLKLLMPGLFLVFLGCAYCVLRRIASPWVCAASIVLTALFQGMVTLTQWFHSDALFFALSWGGLLMAVKAGEAHAAARVSRASGLALGATACLVAAVATRWVGILWWPMLVAGFMHGRALLVVRDGRLRVAGGALRPDAMWAASALSGLLAAGVFFGLRWGLAADPAEVDPRYDPFITGHYALVNPHEAPTIGTHLYRAILSYEWLAQLYWKELARAPDLALAFSRFAAITVVPLAVAGIVGLARRQWIWLGMAAAWLPVVMTWPHPVDRYLGPVAPMLVCGSILGTTWIARWLDGRFATSNLRDAMRRLPFAIMAAPLLVALSYNVGRYGLDVWARLDYYPRYEGGNQPSLNRIAAYLRQNQPALGGEIGITRTGFAPPTNEAEVEERRQKTRLVRRNLIFLSDTTAVDMPAVEDIDPRDLAFIDWCTRNNVRFFVVRPKDSRYFVHLHALPWHAPASEWEIRSEEHVLYEIINGAARRVDVSDWPQEVLLIPGLEDVRQVPGRAGLPLAYD